MENKKKRNDLPGTVIKSVFIVLTAQVPSGVLAYMGQLNRLAYCRSAIISLLVSLFLIFDYLAADQRESNFSWNRHAYLRYAAVAGIGIWGGMAFGWLPFLSVPFPMLAVCLTMVSGGFCGVCGYCVIVLQAVLLYSFGMEEAVVLLVCGIGGALLFSGIDEEFRYAGSLLAFLVTDFVCYALFFVLGRSGAALGDALLYCGIRLFSELVVILLFLKYCSHFWVYWDNSFYVKINNPEYKLLAELKEKDKDAYFHALHTAHLSDRIARRIGADEALARAGGYYHGIGVLLGEDTIENTLTVGKRNHFPRALMELLREYGIKGYPSISREAAIVQLSDAVLSAVSHLFLKDNSTQLNYEKIVNIIIKKKTDSGDFDRCQLNLQELQEIKRAFTEEKLYYDFLR